MANLQLQKFPDQASHQTEQGWTAMHYAAQYDALQTIVVLLEWRGDPAVENSEEKSAFDLASRPKTLKALQGLMKEQLRREELERDNRLQKVR